jgi:copper chaperone
MTTVQYRIGGMSCSGCAGSIERKLQATPGVTSAVVDLAAATATVTYDEAAVSSAVLENIIDRLGFDVLNPAASEERR